MPAAGGDGAALLLLHGVPGHGQGGVPRHPAPPHLLLPVQCQVGGGGGEVARQVEGGRVVHQGQTGEEGCTEEKHRYYTFKLM